MRTRAVGAQPTSRSQGAGLLEPLTAPFFLLSARFSPLRSGGTQRRPPLPALAASSSNSWGVRQPRLRSPRTATSPMLPPRQAKELEGSGTRETNILGASPRVLPSHPPSACHLSLSSSPPLHPSGSKAQALSPRVRVPRGPLLLRWPDSPRVSPVCLRRPCPLGAQDQPQVGEVCAPSSQPATHREEGALRQRPESAPGASRAVHVPEPRLRALARSVLGGLLSRGRHRAGVRGAAWRPGFGPPPRPSRGPLGAQLRPGLSAAPLAPGTSQPAVAEPSPPPALPAPPGAHRLRPAPPRPARLAARTRAPPAPPRHGRAGAWVPSPLSRTVSPDPTLGAKAASEKTPVRSPGFESKAH